MSFISVTDTMELKKRPTVISDVYRKTWHLPKQLYWQGCRRLLRSISWVTEWCMRKSDNELCWKRWSTSRLLQNNSLMKSTTNRCRFFIMIEIHSFMKHMKYKYPLYHQAFYLLMIFKLIILIFVYYKFITCIFHLYLLNTVSILLKLLCWCFSFSNIYRFLQQL